MTSKLISACLIAMLMLATPTSQATATPEAARPGATTAAGLRNFVFINGQAAGWRHYAAKPLPVFGIGETLQFYAEPVALGWTAAGRAFRFELHVDIEVRTRDGRVVWGQKDFGLLQRHSPVVDPNTYITGAVALENVPAGVYVLGMRLRDPLNGRVAETQIHFVLADRTAAIEA